MDISPSPEATPSSGHGMVGKLFLSLLVLMLGVGIGYGMVYSWVYYDLGSRFSISSFKGQILNEQQSKDVQSQLQNLGFDIDSGDFHSLNNAASSHYKSSVLNSFEPEESEAPKEKGYYFYDKQGGAYYVEIGEDGKVDPGRVTPLLSE